MCWYWVFVHLLLCYVTHFQWLLQLFPFQVDQVICDFCVTLFSLVCFVCLVWSFCAQSLFSLVSDTGHKSAPLWFIVKSGSTLVGGPVKSRRRRMKEEGRGLDKKLVWPELVTAWIQRQGRHVLIPNYTGPHETYLNFREHLKSVHLFRVVPCPVFIFLI